MPSRVTLLLKTLTNTYAKITSYLEHMQPLMLLGARCYVAWVFFASGLLKLRDWESTLFLFEEEYSVPLLSPEVAAYMGTAAEIGLPLLLFIGIGSRFAAFGLTVLNIVAVFSLELVAPAALYLHYLWGAALALILFWGPGKISLSNFLLKIMPAKLLSSAG